MTPKRPSMVPRFFVLCMAVMSLLGYKPLLAADREDGQMHTRTGFSYRMGGARDTRQIARALALYGAKHKAVLWLAGQLAGSGLLKDYAGRRMEIVCLAADQLKSSIISESFSEDDGVFSIVIDSRVSLADFVKAEIADAALEKEEIAFSWQEEMEPVLSPTFEPGRELSRAYRYIRKRQWRKAIIYLDHLEKKYPYWGELYFAKALGFEGMHETQRAVRYFRKACERGEPRACRKIRSAAQAN